MTIINRVLIFLLSLSTLFSLPLTAKALGFYAPSGVPVNVIDQNGNLIPLTNLLNTNGTLLFNTNSSEEQPQFSIYAISANDAAIGSSNISLNLPFSASTTMLFAIQDVTTEGFLNPDGTLNFTAAPIFYTYEEWGSLINSLPLTNGANLQKALRAEQDRLSNLSAQNTTQTTNNQTNVITNNQNTGLIYLGGGVIVPATTVATLPSACSNIRTGDLFRVEGSPTVYSLTSQNQLFRTMGTDEINSWEAAAANTNNIATISADCFSLLGSPTTFPNTVAYRPGSYIVRSASSPQLYAVLPGNTLSPISATAARALYGENYTPRVLSEEMFQQYNISGSPINQPMAHEGMLVRYNGKTWYVDYGGTLREVTESGFSANRFRSEFIRPVTEEMISGYVTGLPITGYEENISNRTGR